MADILIKINHLTKSFDDLKILDDISLSVFKGENLVVFGQSGTGKSVLLKCIVRLLVPDSGEILLNGKNVHELNKKQLREVQKNFSFLFQSGALYDSMSVRQNLEFTLQKNFDFTQKEIDDKVKVALESVGLISAIDKMPAELSGGMRKRIALARAVITEPEIMFYDEPTTGLDPITSKEISELILTLQKKLNMTSIIITHDLMCAKIIADRAVFLDKGKIIYEGGLDELVASKDPFLKNFFSFEVIKEESKC